MTTELRNRRKNSNSEAKAGLEDLIDDSSTSVDPVISDENDMATVDVVDGSSVDSPMSVGIKERLLATANKLKFTGKCLGVSVSIWIIGYFNFSVLWLIIGVSFYVLRKYRLEEKERKKQVLSSIAKDEKKYFQTVRDIYKLSGRDLPSWVYFPDIEKAEWLNRMIKQLWPYVGDYVRETIFEMVEPSIRQSHSLLEGFSFSTVDLGDNAPRVSGVKVYSGGRTKRTEIVLDLQLTYQSDSIFRVCIGGLSAGIKDLQVYGVVRVELRPLIKSMPLVGAVSVAFLEVPKIDYDLTDMANLFDIIPGVDRLLHKAISDAVASMMVLPERYVLQLAEDVDIYGLVHPLPKGVVRISIIKAKDLVEKDKKILGMGGRSDPFAIVKVGRTQEFQTKVVEHTVNPVWNQTFDFPVFDTHTSSVEISLYDDDGALSKADDLGSTSIRVSTIFKRGIIDEWLELGNVSRGKIHIRAEWLELSQDVSTLKEAMEYAGKEDRNCAYLSIYVDSAKNLPGLGDVKAEPSSYVLVTVPGNDKPLKTKVVENTNSPVWEENFSALVKNPRMESIDFKVVGEDEDLLGKLRIHINDLIQAHDMCLKHPSSLSDSGHLSTIQLRLTARLLLPKKMDVASLMEKELPVSSEESIVEGEDDTPLSSPDVSASDEVEKNELMPPLPQGVVRIHVIEAKNLMEKDKKVLGLGGGSDPFVIVKAGNTHEFKTAFISHDVNPRWNETFDWPASDVDTSSIEFSVYDDDGRIAKADDLGSTSLRVSSVVEDKIFDGWMTLSNASQGSIHIRLEWLELSHDKSIVEKAMEYAEKKNLNCGFISICVDDAKNLPIPVDAKSEPYSFVKIQVPGIDDTFRTKIVEDTCDPVWDENFQSFIKNPMTGTIDVKIVDKDAKGSLGTLQIPIKELTEADEMTLRRSFDLSNSGPQSTIHLRISIRFFLPSQTDHSHESEDLKSDTELPPDIEEPSLTSPDETKPLVVITNDSSESDDNNKDSELNFANSPSFPKRSVNSSLSGSITSGISSVEESRVLGTRTTNNNNALDSPLGRLLMRINYSPSDERLSINIIKAEKLIACDEDNNTSDPYVRIYLLPHRWGSHRRKTKVVKNNLNPVFEETLEYDIPQGEINQHQLDIEIKNKTGLLSSEKSRMGEIVINLRDYDFTKSEPKWYPLQNLSDD